MDDARLDSFLDDLGRRDIRLSAGEGGELRVQAPRGTLTRALADAITEHKPAILARLGHRAKATDLSLIFFASDDSPEQGASRYDLFLEASRRADRAGFAGIWLPERHFHRMGGIFPNPVVAAAALSTVTSQVKLRSGSVVAPLHDPVRIAEDWAMVDNLSGGRVELSFASGWHVDDFTLAPDAYATRKERMFDVVATVRRLWRGESITRRNGAGRDVSVATRPRPVQAELPFWLTAVGNVETYRESGRLGAHLLTCLLDQDVPELAEKLVVYRRALRDAGFDPASRKVAVFVHTYVGESTAAVRAKVRGPFTRYLESTLELVARLAAGGGVPLDPASLGADERRELLDLAFERYYERRALFGTPDECRARLANLAAAGVDEVACLVDFGLAAPDVLAGIDRLAALQDIHQRNAACLPRTAP